MGVGQDGWATPTAVARTGMDGVQRLLDAVRDNGLAVGHVRGLCHLLIGRKIDDADGLTVSAGLTWRELAERLRAGRFDQDLGLEVGADPEVVAPRDRQRFWYSVIALAQPDGMEALRQAEALAGQLRRLGYTVGPPPGGLPSPPPAPPRPPVKPRKK